jgi:hypothetical protein
MRLAIIKSSLAVTVLLVSPLHAQSVSSLLRRIETSSDNDRIAAFYTLLNPTPTRRFDGEGSTSRLLRDHPRDRSAITLALVNLLRRENVRARNSSGEEFSNYYGDLIWSVATLRDPRSVDALLGAVQTGNMATDGLAALGQNALPGTLRALDNPDAGVRNGVLRVLEKMVMPSARSSLGTASRAQVRTALLRGIEDEDAFNRRVAVRALEPFADDGVRSAIRYLNSTDTSAMVRSAAEAWFRRNGSR